MAIVLLLMLIMRCCSRFRLSSFCCIRHQNGGRRALLLLSRLSSREGCRACLVALVVAMEVVGLVLSCHDSSLQWRLLGLSCLVSLILSSQGRLSGSTCCLLCHEEVFTLISLHLSSRGGLWAHLVALVVVRRLSCHSKWSSSVAAVSIVSMLPLLLFCCCHCFCHVFLGCRFKKLSKNAEAS
jgi:hypothetical protein